MMRKVQTSRFMKLRHLAVVLLLFFGGQAIGGSFSKVKTYSKEALFHIYKGQPAVFDINSATNQVTVYSHDLTQQVSLKLPAPSGYNVSEVYFAEAFVQNDANVYFVYLVKNGSGATQGMVCDEKGTEIKAFSNAYRLELIPAYTEYKLGVVRNTGGVDYTDVHNATNTSFTLEHTFKTASLGSGLPLGQRNGDISDFYYWHVDVATNEFMDYTYDYKQRSKATLSIPSGYKLTPVVLMMYKSFFNASSPYEIGVVYENGSASGASVFESDGTLLQTFSGAKSLIFFPQAFGLGRQAMLAVEQSDGKWATYATDNNKNTDNAYLIFTLPTEPKSTDGYRIAFYEPDSSQVKFFTVDNSGTRITERVGIKFNAGEELLNYAIYVDGNGDANNRQQEVFAHIGYPAANIGRFEVLRGDGTSLLSVSNVTGFQLWQGFLPSQATRIGVHNGNTGFEVYDYDWSLKPVEKISPADGTTDLDNKQVTFTWKSQDNALDYQFQLFEDTVTFKLVFDQKTSNTSITIPHIDSSKTFYWRVVAENSNATNFQGKFFMFTTKDPNVISAPTLLSPSDGASDVVKENLTVSWEAESNARFYEYQVSEDMGFSTFFSGVTANTSGQPTNIKYEQTYYWRVKGFKGNYESDWSDVWSFTVAKESDIKVPTLQSPANHSGSIGLNPILSWLNDNDATGYDIEYADNGLFSGAISESSTENSVSLSELDHETKYYWRVKTKTADGTSDWSVAWTFTTISQGQLASPILLTPANNQEGIDAQNAVLTWTEVDADNYTYEVSTDINFTQPITNNPSEPKATLSTLEENKTYYWRVKANKGTSSSEWSALGTFSTSKPDNISEAVALHFEVYPNPTNEVLNLHNPSNQNMAYSLMSIEGRRLISGTILSNSTTQLHLPHLPAGVYQLVLTSQSRSVSQQVVLSR